MKTPAPTRQISAEEFLHMPESEGAELADGVVVGKNMGNESSWLGLRIGVFVSNYVIAHLLGRVFGPDNGLVIWPDRPNHVLKPGLTFVHRGSRPVRGWQAVVPDLVVEVVSPNDEIEPFERKLADYRAAGINLIWVIYPGTQTAQVLTPGHRLEVPSDGVLDGGDVLPGFTLSLKELFAGLED